MKTEDSKSNILANLRRDYKAKILDEQDALPDPFLQFQLWFDEAMEAQLPEPNAMTLATATKDGIPSARVVLLKGLDEHGFVFYTNYNSHKGRELTLNPHAALVFSWLELERQVRITGLVHKTSIEDSTVYFQSRPKSSQLGAWVSPQSKVIPNRKTLEDNLKYLQAEYANTFELPCPDFWGGYILKPTTIEFWQGRPSRLHDRLLYSLQSPHHWKIERLAP